MLKDAQASSMAGPMGLTKGVLVILAGPVISISCRFYLTAKTEGSKKGAYTVTCGQASVGGLVSHLG